jgi:hypothetical protein
MNDGRRAADSERFDQPSTVYRQLSIVNRLSSIVILLIIGLIVIAPLLQPGYFWGAHDARHDVYFIFQYDKSVQDGIWLPSWGPDWAFGYGYPFWIVYGPLATFVGEVFHRFLGLGFEESVKAVLGLSILLSGLAMYGFVRSWLGARAGLVAAVAYMTVPYHLVDVFVRAAMAESVALVFLPLALWGFRETIVRPRLTAVIAAAFAYAAIMWTSNLVALVFTPGLALYVLALILWQSAVTSRRSSVVSRQSSVVGGRRSAVDRPSSIVHRPSSTVGGRRSAISQLLRSAFPPAAAIAIALGLSAAFFIPALIEQRYINQTQWFGKYYDPFQHFVYFFQLFNPAWGFGISQPGPDDIAHGAMSYQLGAAVTILSLIALIVAARKLSALRREIWFWGAWAVISIFLTLGVSAWVWRHVPIVPYAQFPWRYLMLAILPLSILPGTLVADCRMQNAERRTQPAEPDSSATTALLSDRGVAPIETPRDTQNPIRNTLWPALLLSTLLLLSSAPYFRVEMREPTPEQGPVSMAALMRFQRTSDEMTGVTAWVDPARIPNWSPLADEWVAGREVLTRADYSTIPQNKTLAVNAEAMGSAHDEVWYYAEAPDQSITFNRFWYPGWNAYLLDGKHGKPVQRLEVRREDGPLARVVVPVPPGQGYLLLRFEDTPLRAAAKAISLATLALVGALWLVYTWRQRRTSTD